MQNFCDRTYWILPVTLVVQNTKSELDQTKNISLFETQEMKGKIKWYQGMQNSEYETCTGKLPSFFRKKFFYYNKNKRRCTIQKACILK